MPVVDVAFDWGNDDDGIAVLSGGLPDVPHEPAIPRRPRAKRAGIVWLNLNSKQEVDELFERWKDTGAKIIEAAWNLHEFRVANLDGNQQRVFYDFKWDVSEQRRR